MNHWITFCGCDADRYGWLKNNLTYWSSYKFLGKNTFQTNIDTNQKGVHYGRTKILKTSPPHVSPARNWVWAGCDLYLMSSKIQDNYLLIHKLYLQCPENLLVYHFDYKLNKLLIIKDNWNWHQMDVTLFHLLQGAFYVLSISPAPLGAMILPLDCRCWTVPMPISKKLFIKKVIKHFSLSS